MLKEEREDNEEVDGLGGNGEDVSEGVAAPSICPWEDKGDLPLVPEVLLLLRFRALILGLWTALIDGLPLRLYTPSAPKECGVLKGAAVICRRNVS